MRRFLGVLISAFLLSVVIVPSAHADSAEAATAALAEQAGRISTGEKHACAVDNGEVWCWGFGDWGQNGNGQFGNAGRTSAPVKVGGISNAVSVGLGQTHSCALLDTGTVKCWGRNFWGQLGNGATGLPGGANENTPVDVIGLSDVISISAGRHNTCAAKGDGTVWCWGYNGEGQLGQTGGSAAPSSTPLQVANISNAIEVSYGISHACALLDTGQVMCWGVGSEGRLGNGQTADSALPVMVSGLTDAVAVSAGLQFTCAITASFQAKCWGDNFYTQLGNGMGTDSLVPADVVGLNDAVGISAGQQHACAIRNNATVTCWGRNVRGALGAPGVNAFGSPSPIPSLASITDAVAVSSDDDHSCIITLTENFYCWGQNDYGELGNGSPGSLDSASANTAQLVLNIGPTVQMATCDGLAVTIFGSGGPIAGTPGDDVILGTSGGEEIFAGDGNDTICAGDGNDMVYGEAGNDRIFGEGGNDILRGSRGVDYIDGGDGRDRLLGGIDGDTMYGRDGDDYLGGFGGNDLIFGNAGNDTVFGGFGKDEIHGGTGNDKISGLIGDDTINGDDGNDTLNGDRGNDTIHGNAGNDSVNGGNGADNLFGDGGDDDITGGKADDVMTGGGGTDVCTGNREHIADSASGCETVFGVP